MIDKKLSQDALSEAIKAAGKEIPKETETCTCPKCGYKASCDEFEGSDEGESIADEDE